MKRKIKKKIAYRVLIPVLVVVPLIITAFYWGSYRYILGFINEDKETELASMAHMFHTKYEKEAAKGTIPDEESLKAYLTELGDEICDSFHIDYVSTIIPDFEAVTIKYLTVSNDAYLDGNPYVEYVRNSNDPIVRQQISDEIRKVWEYEKEESVMEYDNEYGHELCYIIREITPYGDEVIVTFEESVGDIYRLTHGVFRILAAVTALMYCLALITVFLSIKRYVSEPAAEVCDAMNRFIIGGSLTDTRLDENREGEFGVISAAFNRMAEDTDKYISDIKAFQSTEERQKAEMDIALKIQEGFLPEPLAYFSGCDICAVMNPAREIGGDLYDYLQLDDDRMLIMIADVSGKGVSAAIFMAAAITLMHEYAKMNLGPAEILERTNRSLAEKNPLMLFATAFAGIYNNRTLEFTYSNAGHNLPYIIEGKAEELSGARGTLLGLFEDETYDETTVTLKPGDILYLYTDGVNEAVSINKEFYGTGRLEKCLSDYKPSSEQSIIQYITENLSEFSKGAEQSDDITMLALTAKAKQSLNLKPETGEFLKIKEMILGSKIPESLKLPLCLCAEEMFVNICSYAFGDTPPDGETVYVSLSLSDHTELRFEDGGIPYDPRADIADPADYDIDNQIGGLGKIITMGIADDIRYEYRNSKNILTIIKY